ncbi:MAG: hypothetical protein KF800_10510 [Lysobacter sp.]|nr:hypothetical protein [Lysobacter sp.]
MRKTVLLSLCLSVFMAHAALASDNRIQLAQELPEIRAAQDALKAAIEKKEGPYARYSESQRTALREQQSSIYRLIDGKQSVNELGEDNRLRLANLLMAQKAQLEQSPEDKMVCERVKVLGSNRPKMQCMSESRREQLREQQRTQGTKMEH